jgi:hypothetical protein
MKANYDSPRLSLSALFTLGFVSLLGAGCAGVTGSPRSSGSPPPPVPTSVLIGTLSLPQGTVQTAYSASLTASGGTLPYQWSLTAGSLPAGLNLNGGTGIISGSPSGSGTINFTVTVQDAKQQTASANLAITINTSGSSSTPRVTTSSLSAGTVGTAYLAVVSASGGTLPYQWSVPTGSLPTGLNLNAATGTISGTPTAPGKFQFSIQVKDSALQVTFSTLAITVFSPTASKLTITTTSLRSATVGDVYSALLFASGGTPPYRWSIASGGLPPGLVVGGSTGAIAGTVTTAGRFNFTVQVTDTSAPQQSGSSSLSIDVSPSGPPPGAVVVTSLGATGNGTTDDTAAINGAIATLRPDQILYFPCGTYAISGSLNTISLSGVTMEGPSENCASLKLTGNASFTAIQFSGGGLSGAQRLVADTTANTFTVGTGGLAAIGISVGSYVLVSDAGVASNGSGSPLISDEEIVKVIGVSGDTATVENTFSHNFTLVSPFPESQGCCPQVQTLINPLSGIAVKHLNVDASANTGPDTAGLLAMDVVKSEIGFLQISNFLGTGISGGVRLDRGYQNNFHDITCTACGNGGSSGIDSVEIRRQSFPTIQGINIKNTAAQSVFSFGLRQTYFGNISNIGVDAGGAKGRPIKLLRASNNVIDNATARNGTGGDNGISVTDMSTDNVFNNCAAYNNEGGGIILFGNHNTHNTFNNCTSMFNLGWQFGQSHAINGTYTDYFTTVNGGTYCCARGASAIIETHSDNFTITGATISDDQGAAIDGLVINGANAVVENNTFSALPSGKDIYAISATNPTFSGNTTPDGTTPSGLASLFHKAKILYAALKYPFIDANR